MQKYKLINRFFFFLILISLTTCKKDEPNPNANVDMVPENMVGTLYLIEKYNTSTNNVQVFDGYTFQINMHDDRKYYNINQGGPQNNGRIYWKNQDDVITIKLDANEGSDYTLENVTYDQNILIANVGSEKWFFCYGSYKLGGVVQAQNGTPVSGAIVYLRKGTSVVTTDTTSTYGIYAFACDLSSDNYMVTVKKIDYNDKVGTTELRVEQNTPKIYNVSLTAGTSTLGKAKLYGNVTNSSNGFGIHDVKITVSGENCYSGISGDYSIYLSPGHKVINATKTGFINKTFEVDLSVDQELQYNFTMNEGSATEATIQGKVTISGSSTPIEGATVRVSAQSKSTTTDASGNYTLVVTPGNITISASKTGYESKNQNLTAIAGNSHTVNFELVAGGNTSIHGTVTNASTSNPVGGVTISVQGQSSTTTDGSGNYTLAVTPGSLIISASLTDFYELTKTVDVTSGQNVAVDFALYSENSGITALYGHVKNTSDDSLSGVTVTIDDSVTTQTDAAGNYYVQIQGISGTTDIKFSLSGYISVMVSTEVDADQDNMKDITMKTSAEATDMQVSGTVYDKSNNPLAGAIIRNDRGDETTSGADGKYSMIVKITQSMEEMKFTASMTGYKNQDIIQYLYDGIPTVLNFNLENAK
jgi:hypothetical protein